MTGAMSTMGLPLRSTRTDSPDSTMSKYCLAWLDATHKWPGETSREWGRPL